MIYLIMCWNDCNLIHIHACNITFINTELVLGCEFKYMQNLSTFMNLSISILSVYTLSQLPGVMYVTVHITYSTMSTEVWPLHCLTSTCVIQHLAMLVTCTKLGTFLVGAISDECCNWYNYLASHHRTTLIKIYVGQPGLMDSQTIPVNFRSISENSNIIQQNNITFKKQKITNISLFGA